MGVTKALKWLAQMKSNPAGNWTIEDVEFVSRNLGLDCKATKRESHYVVSHAKIEGLLTIPAKRPIKPIYIKLLVGLAEISLEIE